MCMQQIPRPTRCTGEGGEVAIAILKTPRMSDPLEPICIAFCSLLRSLWFLKMKTLLCMHLVGQYFADFWNWTSNINIILQDFKLRYRLFLKAEWDFSSLPRPLIIRLKYFQFFSDLPINLIFKFENQTPQGIRRQREKNIPENMTHLVWYPSKSPNLPKGYTLASSSPWALIPWQVNYPGLETLVIQTPWGLLLVVVKLFELGKIKNICK